MRSVEIVDESFEPRTIEFSETNEEEHSFKMIEIVLRIEKELEYRVLDDFSDSNVVINEDGSFVVTMKSIEDDWLYGYILSFGSSAVVLSPLKLRKAMATMIGEMSSNYSKEVD